MMIGMDMVVVGKGQWLMIQYDNYKAEWRVSFVMHIHGERKIDVALRNDLEQIASLREKNLETIKDKVDTYLTAKHFIGNGN